MHLLTRLLVIWGTLAVEVTASTLNQDTDKGDGSPPSSLPRPSQDEWYSGPPGWESAAPGTVLRVRPHAYRTPPGFRNYIDVVQVLFRTTDSHDRPLFAATTVFIPESHAACLNSSSFMTTSNNSTSTSNPKFTNATAASSPTPIQGNANNCSHALISYHLPYDTSCFDATPSYGLQKGEPYGEIAISLARGWFVSVPDYEGPRASYGANVLTGRVILDSARALLKALPAFGFRTDNNASRVALWGYSSGATATEFAVEQASSYAPDLRIAGAAMGGLAANATRSLPLLNGRDVAGLLIQSLIGCTAEYPDLRKYLDSRLKPEGPYNASEFYTASKMNGIDSLKHFTYQNIFEYFIGGKSDVFVPEMVEMFDREGMTGRHGTPKMPVFIYQSVLDDMCPADGVDDVVSQFCADGANIVYHRNAIGGHNPEGTNGRQRALDFLGDVLDGTNVAAIPVKGCKVVDLEFEQPLNVPCA